MQDYPKSRCKIYVSVNYNRKLRYSTTTSYTEVLFSALIKSDLNRLLSNKHRATEMPTVLLDNCESHYNSFVSSVIKTGKKNMRFKRFTQKIGFLFVISCENHRARLFRL